MVDRMVDLGLPQLGYTYFNLDGALTRVIAPGPAKCSRCHACAACSSQVLPDLVSGCLW
jgi:hypothetical protein